jgi:asparagine synthase (glutamine-hydrolysing)
VTGPPPPQLTPLEIASGLVLARPGALPKLPRLDPGTTPRAALEAAILPALRCAPCLVSFSGGRDSSAVLAAAVAVARREGLPVPVPITYRFPAAAGTEESAWQEQVIAHLGLDDWMRVALTSELDAVGPVATSVIARHGLLWPCNTYFHDPVFEAASGGAVLTGIGGDEAFMGCAWDRALAVLQGRVRPAPRDVLRVGFALAPTPVKAAFMRRWLPDLFPWLRADARREVEARIATDAAQEPLRHGRRLRRLLGSPALRAGLQGLQALAADWDVRLEHPLHDPRFLAALAAEPSRNRYRSRSESMEALIGDLLPPQVLRRSTKSHFSEVLWGETSLELATSWDGGGIDPELVDAERLRKIWVSAEPSTQTLTLLQSVWWTRARAGAAPSPAPIPSPAGG